MNTGQHHRRVWTRKEQEDFYQRHRTEIIHLMDKWMEKESSSYSSSISELDVYFPFQEFIYTFMKWKNQ